MGAFKKDNKRLLRISMILQMTYLLGYQYRHIALTSFPSSERKYG
jgi:hypothetical protein